MKEVSINKANRNNNAGRKFLVPHNLTASPHGPQIIATLLNLSSYNNMSEENNDLGEGRKLSQWLSDK